MSKQPNGSDAPMETPPVKNAALLMISDAADTAWRMFVPTVGATLLGVWADAKLGTKPWIMIFLMIVGVAVMVLLVRRQLQRVNNLK